jgi:hypothetical protein
MSSIYDWLKAEIEAGTFESGCRLPDHADLGADGDGWVPGAYESLLMRSTYSIRRSSIQNFLLARKVRKQILDPSEQNEKAEETALLKSGALAAVDPLISFLYSMKTDKAKMRDEALRLASTSRKRELVKVGIALLGACGDENEEWIEGDKEVLLTLARHEEFTFYAAPALRARVGADKVNEYLLPLCDLVDGWGKTAILYELNYEKTPAGTPAIEYLLRRGCKNRLGLALNANLCATKGRLAEKLEELCAEDASLPDGELWTGICDVMEGLTAFDGIHDSLNDYKFGIRARDAFATLIGARTELTQIDPRGEEILQRMR